MTLWNLLLYLLILGLIQVPDEASVITKATAGSSICSWSLGREGPGTAQAEFLNYCLTHSGHLRLVVRLHHAIISMCWKVFLFSVLSIEGMNFSLLLLEKRLTKKAGIHLQNSSRIEISQSPPSFASLSWLTLKTTIWYYFIYSLII